MFTPSHFKITDHAEIYSFIDLNGFGQIISTVAGQDIIDAPALYVE